MMAPGAGNSDGYLRAKNIELRIKKSPDTSPKEALINNLLHGRKSNEWQLAQIVVKEVLKLNDLCHGVIPGGKEPSQLTENTLTLAVDSELYNKWVPMFELLKQYKAECKSTDVPFNYKDGLGRWVDKQQCVMNILPNRRRAMLDQLEFV